MPARLLPILVGLLPAAAAAGPPPGADDVTLRAVTFADKSEGWAVGDAGVVLHTIDGGKSWDRQPTGTKASLRAVQFLSPYTGWAVGRVDRPGGAPAAGVVLATADGGATWREVTTALLPGLTACRFIDENTGVVAGDKTPAFPTGVFETADGGKTWAMAPGDRPGRAGDASARGEHPAGGPARLGVGRRMTDDRTGWEVGHLGTISRTTDGGKSWEVVKAGGRRAAVLFVHARAEAVPLGAVALLGKDGYLCAAVAGTAADEPRLAAAMRAAGGAAGVGLPAAVPGGGPAADETGWVLASGRQLAGPAADPAAIAAIVRAIRTWQPEVIVTDTLSPAAAPADRSMLRRVRLAFDMAADRAAFPEQIEAEGLAPHAAKKLLYLADGHKDKNEVGWDLTAFVPEFGASAAHHVEPAGRLLGVVEAPPAARFLLGAHRLPGAEGQSSLMAGIDLAEGGTARRKKAAAPDLAATAEREQVAATRRRLDALLATPDRAGGWDATLTAAGKLVAELPDADAAKAGVAAGLGMAAAGRWTAARELLALVADRYPAHPEAVEAIGWLIRYQSSGEVRRRIELGHLPVFGKATFTATDPGVRQAAAGRDPFPVAPAFRFASPEAAREWHEAGLELEPKLAGFGAGYARDPGVNLCLAAARRNLGLYADAGKQVRAVVPPGDPAGGGPWAGRLADEGRLLGNQPPTLTPAAECRATAGKPVLDGKLDDDCWKEARPVAVAEVGGGYRTDARFAVDGQFLYAAVTCRHPDGKQVPKADKRARDEDLRGHDRVELLVDLDRDTQTAYRLRVDHRGCVAEDCWGDPAWDPKWFVAVDPSPTGWTAELAVPLAELTGAPPAAGQVWGLNVLRVVPGVGAAALAGPADTPAALGLLRFVAAK